MFRLDLRLSTQDHRTRAPAARRAGRRWLAALRCRRPSTRLTVDAIDEVTQISTYPALERGLYDGDVTYAQLAQAGNFGIGTFDGMDGEMIALAGQFYQARSDGSVRRADKTLETPFATVTFFTAEQRLQPDEPLANYDQLKAYLASVAPPANRPYAIRIDGMFPVHQDPQRAPAERTLSATG